AHRLLADHLEPARIRAARELACPLRRHDVVETDDAALDLRDGLLGDDDDVAVLELRALGDERGEVVAFLQLLDPFNRHDRDHASRSWPAAAGRAGPAPPPPERPRSAR